MNKNKLIVALIVGAVAVMAYLAGGRVTLDVQYPAPVAPVSGPPSALPSAIPSVPEDLKIESSKADFMVAPGSVSVVPELDVGV